MGESRDARRARAHAAKAAGVTGWRADQFEAKSLRPEGHCGYSGGGGCFGRECSSNPPVFGSNGTVGAGPFGYTERREQRRPTRLGDCSAQDCDCEGTAEQLNQATQLMAQTNTQLSNSMQCSKVRCRPKLVFDAAEVDGSDAALLAADAHLHLGKPR